VADVGRQAVSVLRARREERGRAVADVGIARDAGRRLTDTQPVARPAGGQVRQTGGAGWRRAHRAGAVEPARALAVAEPVGAAAGGTLVSAARLNVDRSGGDVAAHAQRRRQRARLADARAGRFAADALLAEALQALLLLRAERALRLESAGSVLAHGGRLALAVVRARRVARV